MEIRSLRSTWFLLPSDTMWTMGEHSEYTVICILVIGGGPYRCVNQNLFYSITDEQSQHSLESRQPGATVLPLIISTDKTQLTIFGGKMAYPVYMTIGNI